jgi:hypothetical protein
MKNWTDTCINWNQLPATEVRRLIDTWGFTPEKIAKYDKKHGFNNTPAKVATPQVPALAGMTPLGIKPQAKTATVTVKKADLKKPTQARRQKHMGADGEVKYVEHRKLYIGFMGGRVVVTRRTAEQCREFLATLAA